MTNAAVREATLKSLQGSTLTRHHGRPTYKNVETTRKEVAQAFAKAKTSHNGFPMGDKFGMAAAVLKNRKFINLHNTPAATIPDTEKLDKAWEFYRPTRPEPYDKIKLPQGLSAQKRDVIRKKPEAVRNEDIVQYDICEAFQTHYNTATKMTVTRWSQAQNTLVCLPCDQHHAIANTCDYHLSITALDCRLTNTFRKNAPIFRLLTIT